MSNRRRALLQVGNDSYIPPAYRSTYCEVAYLEACGSQRINIGSFTSNDRMRISVANWTLNNYSAIFGGQYVSMRYENGWMHVQTTRTRHLYEYTAGTIVSGVIELDNVNDTAYVEGKTEGSTYSTSSNANQSVYLFGKDSNTYYASEYAPSGTRIYLAEKYTKPNGGEWALSVRYVPCFRKSDQKPGMLAVSADQTAVFKVNTTGHGEFVCGPRV